MTPARPNCLVSARIGSEHEIRTLILPRSRPPIQLKGSSKWISRIRGECSTSQAHARFAPAKNQDTSRLTEPANTTVTNVSVYASVGSVWDGGGTLSERVERWRQWWWWCVARMRWCWYLYPYLRRLPQHCLDNLEVYRRGCSRCILGDATLWVKCTLAASLWYRMRVSEQRLVSDEFAFDLKESSLEAISAAVFSERSNQF